MIDRICTRITQRLVDKSIIEFDDYDIYMYGLQLFISTIFKGIGIFVVAYALGWVKETAVFLLAFSTLRVNAGGYHSSTYFRCFVLTELTIIISIILAKYIAIYGIEFITIGILTISILLVLQYAPVDTPNKPLTDKECVIYRRRSIALVILESLIIVVAYILKKDFIMYCNIAAVAILVEALTLIPFISKSSEKVNKSNIEEV